MPVTYLCLRQFFVRTNPRGKRNIQLFRIQNIALKAKLLPLNAFRFRIRQRMLGRLSNAHCRQQLKANGFLSLSETAYLVLYFED